MNKPTLTTYMTRAGIRSNRELAKLTGIACRTLDRIVEDPRRARGYQLDDIGEACGMTAEEVGSLILKR